MRFKSLNIYLLITIIFGLISLFVYTFFYSPTEISLLEDNTEYLEKVVSLKGTLKDLSLVSNNSFFYICSYSKCLKAVYFNIPSKDYDLLKQAILNNQQVKVTGKYTIYREAEEIIVYKFEVQ